MKKCSSGQPKKGYGLVSEGYGPSKWVFPFWVPFKTIPKRVPSKPDAAICRGALQMSRRARARLVSHFWATALWPRQKSVVYNMGMFAGAIIRLIGFKGNPKGKPPFWWVRFLRKHTSKCVLTPSHNQPCWGFPQVRKKQE